MALVSLGVTRCSICHKIIQKGDRYIAFPPLTANKLDPLILFSDAACHYDCFINHPLADAAIARRDEVDLHNKKPHICIVCGLAITNPDDFFVLPHWTDNRDSGLFEFNYLKFHLSHLPDWPKLGLLYELLLELEKSGSWDGATLANTIDTLRNVPFPRSNIPLDPGAGRI